MSRKYFYGKISNAQDLKALHDEASLHGKLEVGLSGGKILYAWDAERDNIRSIRSEEAAERLGLTLHQIDQIIATGADVVFEETEVDAPEQELVEDIKEEADVRLQEESIPEPAEGIEEVAETEDENQVEESVEATESTAVEEAKENLGLAAKLHDELLKQGIFKEALIKLADTIIEALEEFKQDINKSE